MRFFAALVLALALPASAQAIYAGQSWVTDPVIGHPDITYLDLLRQIAPDLAPVGNDTFRGTLAEPLRQILGGDPSAAAGERVAVDSATALPLRAEGKERLLVMAELGEGERRATSVTVLALFDDSPRPHLLDAADVSDARHTMFFSPPLLDLSRDDQAILVSNGDDRYGPFLESTLLLFVRGDRLTMIGNVSDLSKGSCSFEHLQKPAFEVVPDAGQPYAAIRASVYEQIIVHDADCGSEKPPAPFERTLSATFRWSAEEKRFIADSDALEKLAAENAERF